MGCVGLQSTHVMVEVSDLKTCFVYFRCEMEDEALGQMIQEYGAVGGSTDIRSVSLSDIVKWEDPNIRSMPVML